MRPGILSVDDALWRATRVAPLAAPDARGVRTAELAALLLTGAAASVLTNVVRFNLGIPGSSIIFAAFPIAFGFALVPRRGAGSVMAGGALATSVLLWLAGVRLDGVGAQTSLLLTGPLLDLALRWAHHGWRLYGAFVLACAASNALAFVVRGSAKLIGIAGAGRGGGGGGIGAAGKPFDVWLPQAMWTYAVAGTLAGLVSAVVWFHLRERGRAGGGRR
jgi:hypothetical protein